jgi:DNA-binding NtrC family response regulator
MKNILLFVFSEEERDLLSVALQNTYALHYAHVLESFISDLHRQGFDLLIMELEESGTRGISLLEEVRRTVHPTPIIVLSRDASPEFVVKALKAGAYDFLSIPPNLDKLRHTLRQALESRQIKGELEYLRGKQDVVYDFDKIIARSPSMAPVISTLKKFSQTDSTILITGETGTGKSFLSGAIHFNSSRRDNPFITINCANLSESLLESELFGHEKGAFTGAIKTRTGRLEQGKGGTVFLDEIFEINQSLQSKLLRVLEDKTFERIGGNRTIHTDARIISATNKNPEEEVAAGRFREDLYYRLNILRLHIPPLRERRQCIIPLSQFMLNRVCSQLRKKINGFAPETLELLKAFSWPGNIRQLANTIERAAILEDSPLIQPDNIILAEIPSHVVLGARSVQTPQSIKENEKELIVHALEEKGWVQKDAAQILGISPRVLNYKIKKYGITHSTWRKNK